MGMKRLCEIMQIARKLNWFKENKNPMEYPLMQSSEVEKCLIMMFDDNELEFFRNASNDSKICAMNQKIIKEKK